MILFFFFQAEDGIRDLYVTGVQTCALPISVFVVPWQRADRTLGIRGAAWVRPDNSQAAVVDPEPGTVTGVRRLYPGVPAIEREVDPRESHTSVLHTDRVVTRVASFKINEVV